VLRPGLLRVSDGPSAPWRVLFLCTGNSARSQIAEALLNRKGRGRFVAESAGSQPVDRVNPRAIAVLEAAGLAWGGRAPRGLDAIADQSWDLVITVCDRAKESCPIFPGQPVIAHWGMSDPAAVEGDDATMTRAFEDAVALLGRRIDLLLALPVEKVERLKLARQVRAIAESTQTPAAPTTVEPR